ncbi:MAG TPA: SDR family oxidoreductase [Steroidobacteraceae bacterium]|nr:SDR family oxidoreductase [Steroidobacteraceae bacterium]
MTAPRKTMLITGAAQGVGLATAGLLAQRECRVILVDIQSVEQQVAQLRNGGSHAEGICGDVSSEEFVQQLAQRISSEYGALDGLVNNAGISLIMPAEETTAAQWQRVMAINLFAPFLLCRHLGAQMLARRQGSIVNVASVAGLAGISHRSAYNTSKHGLVGLTKTLAAEWGGRGVRVNAVCPGWIKTEMDAVDQARGTYGDTDIIDRVPLARFAKAQDVAEAIAFLLDSDRNGFINGITLPVDGGWTADGSWNSLRLSTRA